MQETGAQSAHILPRRALRMRRISIYVSIVATGIILVGYIFNMIL